MSHTVRVKADYGKNPKALENAVKGMGGTWLGQGKHRLYENSSEGLGFKLPGWNYPLVLTVDGTLAYDDYGGSWGNPKDLDKLGGEFAMAAAATAADAQGWIHERNGDTLTIYHPDGGLLTVNKEGVVDAQCFEGRSCASATEPITRAIGREIDTTAKADMFLERNKVQNQE